jgi:hypothetical protein
MRAQPNHRASVTPNTAMPRGGSYDALTGFSRCIAMERLLLLWDELDDLMGTSRYYMKNTAIAIWSTVRPR